MLLGVDVGGTFTDAVLVAGDRLHTAKAPSTPRDQSEGVMHAVAGALEAARARPGDVEIFAHGMTVATNALLERKGPRTPRRSCRPSGASPPRSAWGPTACSSPSRTTRPGASQRTSPPASPRRWPSACCTATAT